MRFSRRQFLFNAGFSAFTTQFVSASTVQPELKVGYNLATWNEPSDQAIQEIVEIGYRGIQIDQSDHLAYADRAPEFRNLLSAKKLSLIALSANPITLNPANMKSEIAACAFLAKWLKEAGGEYLQVNDDARQTILNPDPALFRKLGKHLTEIGKRTLGEHAIKLAYHNHPLSLGARRDEIDRIMESADPKCVWLSADIGNLFVSGADEVRFVRDYLNRLAYPNLKDIRLNRPASVTLDGTRISARYDVVELGQGKVNLAGVIQILKDYRYQGWVLVELDQTLKGRTSKESAYLSKTFLAEKLKVKF